MAYAEYLRSRNIQAEPWYHGEADGEAEFVMGQFPALKFPSDDTASRAQHFILVDSSDLDGIPAFISPSLFVEVIDHRFYTKADESFPNAHLQIENVGAAATLVAERFMNNGSSPSSVSATLLYGAIHSNTLNLKGDLTTSRDVIAAKWLEKIVVALESWLERQFLERKRQIIGNFHDILRREMKEYSPSTFRDYKISQAEMVGARHILQDEYSVIIDFLNEDASRHALNLVDIEASQSFFVTLSTAIQDRIKRQLKAEFVNNVATFQDGIHFIRLNEKPESLNSLAQRLIAIGCEAKLTGSDYLSVPPTLAGNH